MLIHLSLDELVFDINLLIYWFSLMVDVEHLALGANYTNWSFHPTTLHFSFTQQSLVIVLSYSDIQCLLDYAYVSIIYMYTLFTAKPSTALRLQFLSFYFFQSC